MNAVEFLTKVVVVIHSISGVFALLSGLLNMMRTKGDKKHRGVGSFFVWMILISSISGILLSLKSGNWFLCAIGAFTAFMAYTGNMYKQKDAHNAFEVVLVFVMAAIGLFLFGYGIGYIIGGGMFGAVHLVFGGILLFLVRTDLLVITKKRDFKKIAHIEHVSRMTGAFIAALTAFLVVNGYLLPDVLPGFVIWLLPTVIFTPFAVYWSRKSVTRK